MRTIEKLESKGYKVTFDMSGKILASKGQITKLVKQIFL
jgi:hypothetical protein